MPCAAGPITSAAVNVPVMVAGAGGHAWVPGELPRFVHRNTEMPPLTPGWPKWMWAWVGAWLGGEPSMSA